MPRISVIMPVYNSEKYVSDAIKSVLNQTYSDFELIVINDCSKDHSREVIEAIKDDRIVFINNEENKGFLYGLNYGISISKGEYIARLDDDDLSYPTRFEKQVSFLDERKDVVLLGTLMDSLVDGKLISNNPLAIRSEKQIRFSLLFGNHCIPHSSFMMRKKVMKKNNIQYETFIQVPDYHMQTQMLEVGEIACIPEVLVTYRIHAAQSTQVRSIKMKTEEIDRARLWYLDRLNISKEDKESIKRGILRKLKNKQDVNSFTHAFLAYAERCGLSRENLEDKEAISFIYRDIIRQQMRTVGLLSGCIENESKILLGNDLNLKFIIKCLIRRNPDYVTSEY